MESRPSVPAAQMAAVPAVQSTLSVVPQPGATNEQPTAPVVTITAPDVSAAGRKKAAPTERTYVPLQEQWQRLQAKAMSEVDLLEEMRAFMQVRLKIEAEYAQSLQRLSSSYLARRKWPQSGSRGKGLDGQEHLTVVGAWRALLEETAEQGKSHQRISDRMLSEIVEPIKVQVPARRTAQRRAQERSHRMSTALGVTQAEVDRARRTYADFERVAATARAKFAEAETRLKRSSMRLFQTKTDLEKKVKKAEEKLSICEKRAQLARHELILSICASNAHYRLYYGDELPLLMAYLDGDYYSCMREYMQTYAEVFSEAFSSTTARCKAVSADASTINREYENAAFLAENATYFVEPSAQQFVPLETDGFTDIVVDDSSRLGLEKETENLVANVVRAEQRIRSREHTLQGLSNMASVYERQPEFGTVEAREEAEQNAEAIRIEIRELRLAVEKWNARIAKLASLGFRADEYRSALLAKHEAHRKAAGGARPTSVVVADTDDDRGSTISETDAAATAASAAAGAAAASSAVSSAVGSTTGITAASASASLGGVLSSAAAAGKTAGAPGIGLGAKRASAAATASSAGAGDAADAERRCVALYDYVASTTEELSIREDEQLMMLEMMDDGWCRVRSKLGHVGLVPTSYTAFVAGDAPPEEAAGAGPAIGMGGGATMAAMHASTPLHLRPHSSMMQREAEPIPELAGTGASRLRACHAAALTGGGGFSHGAAQRRTHGGRREFTGAE